VAIGHIAVRVHSRSRGHTVAAALAYRCGLDLRCGRTGERFDFRRRAARSEIAAAGFVGTSAPGRYAPARMQPVAQAFADAVEAGERRSNSSILRDVQMALPHELESEDRIALTERFAARISDRYNVPAAFAVHAPDAHGDARNYHAHIVVPTRDRAGKKLRVLDDRRTGPAEIKALRTLWEELANAALVAAGNEPTVDTGRRLDADPQPTLGTERTGIERRHRRERRLPYAGRSVAKMCSDGHAVTGRGRRLGRHTRDTEQARAVDQIVAEREADVDAGKPAQRRRRRRRPRPNPAPVPHSADAIAAELADVDEALANARAERAALVHEAASTTSTTGPVIEAAPVALAHEPEDALDRAPTAEPDPFWQELPRAATGQPQTRSRETRAEPAAIHPDAWMLIETQHEPRETTMPAEERIDAAGFDWHTARHVDPQIARAATRAPELVRETDAKTTGGTPERTPQQPSQTRAAPPPPAPPETPATPETPPTPAPEAETRIALDSVDLTTLQHVEPAPAPARSAALTPADSEAWKALRGEPITRLEIEVIRRQIQGSPTRPSLEQTVDAIAREHLEGRTASDGGDRLQSAREILATVLRSDAATTYGAHLLLDALDAHARAGAGIESWRAQWPDVQTRLLRTVLPREVAELRAEARHEAARARHVRRQRFGANQRRSRTENTTDGNDR